MTKEQLKELVDKLIITDTSVYAYYTDEKHADALKNLTIKDLKNNGFITLINVKEDVVDKETGKKPGETTGPNPTEETQSPATEEKLAETETADPKHAVVEEKPVEETTTGSNPTATEETQAPASEEKLAETETADPKPTVTPKKSKAVSSK